MWSTSSQSVACATLSSGTCDPLSAGRQYIVTEPRWNLQACHVHNLYLFADSYSLPVTKEKPPPRLYPSKRWASARLWIGIGAASETMAQRWVAVGSACVPSSVLCNPYTRCPCEFSRHQGHVTSPARHTSMSLPRPICQSISLPCKAKRQYLLTCKVSRYCLSALQSISDISTAPDQNALYA